MWEYYPAHQRGFAVLVLPAVDGYQLTIDDIFDADDNLKPEYEGYCQYFTQDGKVEKYDFVCPDMPTNKMWITATQEIAEITLFAENVFEPLAISFFYNYFVEGNDMFGDPVGSAIDPIVETVDMSFDYATFEYKVKLYFKANTTSEERSRPYGFGIFSETSGSESYLPAYGFEIVQSANIE